MSGCVILVERDTLVREGLSALLHAWAFDVASGTDPREAMARAAGTVAPRLGIIAAPDGDAVRDARWIASLRFRDRDLPIVLTADDFIDAIWLPNSCTSRGRPIRRRCATLLPLLSDTNVDFSA
jgi:DNA-binding NarL/FixJ family response regulator